MMRYLVGGAVWLVTLVFLAGTMKLNFEFGRGFGRSALEQDLFGWIAVGFDLLKALLPMMIWSALRRARVIVAGLGSLLWVGCLAISLASAAGVAASVRAQEAEAKANAALSLESRKRVLQRKEARRQELGARESIAVGEGKVAELKTRFSWRSTKGCADINGKEQRDFCHEMLEAQKRLEESREAATLDDDIARLQTELQGSGAVQSGGHAQVDLLARLLKLPRGLIEDGLSLSWVVTIEIVACFGFLLAATHVEAGRVRSRPVEQGRDAPPAVPPQLPPPEGRVLEFAALMLEPAEGARLSYDEAFSAYATWCDREGKRPTTRDTLVSELIRLGRDEPCWRVEERGIGGVRVAA